MTRTFSRHVKGVLERVLYLAKLRDVALEHFERGAPHERVRASAIAKVVAPLVDVENSPTFRGDLAQALRGAGWRWVRVGNVRLWKGARAR